MNMYSFCLKHSSDGDKINTVVEVEPSQNVDDRKIVAEGCVLIDFSSFPLFQSATKEE